MKATGSNIVLVLSGQYFYSQFYSDNHTSIMHAPSLSCLFILYHLMFTVIVSVTVPIISAEVGWLYLGFSFCIFQALLMTQYINVDALT